MDCLILTALFSMNSFATYRPHIVPPHRLLNQIYHNQFVFGMALIKDGLTPAYVPSP